MPSMREVLDLIPNTEKINDAARIKQDHVLNSQKGFLLKSYFRTPGAHT